MPTTSRRRGRGSTPIGESVPVCVTSTISSPTNAPSRSATPSPMTYPAEGVLTRRRDVVEAPPRDRVGHVGDARLELRVDPLDVDEHLTEAGPGERLALDRRRGGRDPLHRLELPCLGAVVGEAAPEHLPDIDMRLGADDPIAHLLLQAGHQGQRDDQRGDPDRHASDRYQRRAGDGCLLPPRQQVAGRDVELKGKRHRDSLVSFPLLSP